MRMELTAAERTQEKLIARTLRFGSSLSFALLVLAVAMYALNSDYGAVAARIGVLAILATPILRVFAAIVGFAKANDTRMVLVSLGILAIIGLSALGGFLLK